MRLLYLGAVTVLCLVCNEVYAEVDLEFSGTLVADPCVLTIDSEEQVVDFGAIASIDWPLEDPDTSPLLT